ncbi:MAG: uroporphyrinogen-III synthase [Betaproteobacteria bacterium]|nr:uroporphyrinogen-III synthase [Betaproteobacteria bacterium]
MKPQLAGAGILVTRPEEQSVQLARLIRDAGGEPILFPALEIEPLAETAMAPVLNHLLHFDLVVFVSPNAARMAMPQILKNGGLPAHAKVAAVGPGTAAELKKSGVRNIISPREGFDSEALMGELSAMPFGGSRALIVRGRGGREFLGETLRSRGAAVEYLECYRRVKPDRDMRELLSRSGRDGMKACLATSSSIVGNLFEMAGAAGRSWLCSLPFFVPHPRVAATAFSRRVQCVFVAGNGDEALVAGLETWFARLRVPHPAS